MAPYFVFHPALEDFEVVTVGGADADAVVLEGKPAGGVAAALRAMLIWPAAL